MLPKTWVSPEASYSFRTIKRDSRDYTIAKFEKKREKPQNMLTSQPKLPMIGPFTSKIQASPRFHRALRQQLGYLIGKAAEMI
jgi:hypothetical protein